MLSKSTAAVILRSIATINESALTEEDIYIIYFYTGAIWNCSTKTGHHKTVLTPNAIKLEDFNFIFRTQPEHLLELIREEARFAMSR